MTRKCCLAFGRKEVPPLVELIPADAQLTRDLRGGAAGLLEEAHGLRFELFGELLMLAHRTPPGLVIVPFLGVCKTWASSDLFFALRPIGGLTPTPPRI